MKNRLNIAVRLVLGNTLAIVAVVGIYGYFNLQRIASIFSVTSLRQTAILRENLQERGVAEAKRVASNTAFALSNNDYGYVQNALKPLVEADASLAFAFILDRDQALVAKGSYEDTRVPARVIELEQQQIDRAAEAREIGQGSDRSLLVSVPVTSGDRFWGRVVLGYSLKGVVEQLRLLERWREDESRKSMWATVVFAAVLSVLGSLATVLPTVSATRPILTLTRAAEQLANGKLGITVDVQTDGELGILGAAFNHMSAQLAGLVEEVKLKAGLEKEIEIAELVQEALIPVPELQRVGGMELVGRYYPASRCGGDWWSYYEISPYRTLILVGDVTGHGVSTTLITASVNACCDVLRKTTEELQNLSTMGDVALRDYIFERQSLNYLLLNLNQLILKVGRGRFMMTFSAVLLDTRANKMLFANAGHEPPLLIPGDDSRSLEPVYIGPSVRLGESTRPQFQEGSCSFFQGDTLVWYTDGLVETANIKQQAYGIGRLMRVLKKGRRESVEGLSESVVNSMVSFAQGMGRQDDMTIVIVRNSRSDHEVRHDFREPSVVSS
ncbi:MAG: SpoIIE family protein phosphatase [Myxococcales bacterium]|nr:SpoIIE family protein phosphatase [Myxococcales bacterium]